MNENGKLRKILPTAYHEIFGHELSPLFQYGGRSPDRAWPMTEKEVLENLNNIKWCSPTFFIPDQRAFFSFNLKTERLFHQSGGSNENTGLIITVQTAFPAIAILKFLFESEEDAAMFRIACADEIEKFRFDN